MNTGRVLFSMLKADFQERTRRSSFLVIVCLVIYLGYAVNAGQILIKLDSYRGVYNSAWVGSLMALVITFFLGLTGFYLVKDAIQRDERTGVGQIIATTPLTRPQYLLGKWLSNFALLATLVGILALAAILMQILHRETAQIEIWALVAPFLFIALPMIALVAAFAIFFESVSWLKGGFGNLVYFGVFMAIFIAGIYLKDLPWLDVTGFALIDESMKAAAKAAFPDYSGSFVLSMASDQPLRTFVWNGVHWTAGVMLPRLGWLAVSIGVVLLGGLFFDRFDPRRRSLVRRRPAAVHEMATLEQVDASTVALKPVRLTPLEPGRRFHLNVLRLIWLESLLLLKGQKWYWWAGMALFWIGCATAPPEICKFWYMLAAVWPVLLWSQMGPRETHYQVEQLIYPVPHPTVRLLASAWLAGVAITAVLLGGVLVGRLAAGEPLLLAQWLLSVVFIPTLALALGVWSRSSKPFEVIYPILWYLGPFNRDNGMAVIDYLGLHAPAPINTAPLLFAGFLGLLLLLAYIGRRRSVTV